MITRFASLLCLGASLLVAGEPAAWDWPKALLMGVEEVKPGKAVAHQQNEFAWSKALAEAKSPYHFTGMTPVAGPNQAWWAWPAKDMATVDAMQAFVDKQPALKARIDALSAKDGEFLLGYHSTLYLLRGDLSRGPVDFSPRFYWVFKDHLRPGHEAEYTAMCKNLMGFYDKAGMKAKWGIYQSLAGTDAAHFMVVIPLKSMADLDAMLAEEAKFAQAAGEEGLKTLARLESEAVGKEASILLAVDPKLSYPDARDLAADPEFWKAWTAKPAPKPKKE